MGCFNFDCPNCGVGTHRDENGEEWEDRDYFGATVRISVPTKKGGMVILEGRYSGYGEVEVEFGGKTIEFYPKQFEEYWDCWNTEMQYLAQEIYCETCMENYPLTSRATFDLSDFTLAVDYMATHEKPRASMAPWGASTSKWGTALVTPVPAPAPQPAPPPAKAAKVVKPKPLKKEDLAKKVAEMTAELERLRPLESRFMTLEAENVRLREDLHATRERLDKIRKAVNGY
jgi:hypothetical protein